MDPNPTPLRMPGGMVEDLSVLDKRASGLMSKGRLLAVVGGLAAAACAAVAYLWAGAVEPSTVLKSVHVPGELLQMFSDANGLGTTIGAFDPLVSLLTSESGRIALLVLVTFCGAGALVLGRSGWASTCVGIGMGVLTLHLPLFPPVCAKGIQHSDHTVFAQCAKEGDYTWLARTMESVGAAPDLRNYVLAQAVLVQARGQGRAVLADESKLLRQHVGALYNALQQGAKPAVDGAAMYALDVVAFARPRTEAARRYFAEASSSAQSWRRVGGLLVALAGIVGAAGTGLAFVGHRIRRRADRIRKLVGLERVEEPAAAAPSKRPQERLGNHRAILAGLADRRRHAAQACSTPTESPPIHGLAAGVGGPPPIDASTDPESPGESGPECGTEERPPGSADLSIGGDSTASSCGSPDAGDGGAWG